MTHVTCRMTAKKQDQLRNPTLQRMGMGNLYLLLAHPGSRRQTAVEVCVSANNTVWLRTDHSGVRCCNGSCNDDGRPQWKLSHNFHCCSRSKYDQTHVEQLQASSAYSQPCQFCAAIFKYADSINMKHAMEMWYRIAGNQLPHLVPQGSGHMDGAMLLPTRWPR